LPPADFFAAGKVDFFFAVKKSLQSSIHKSGDKSGKDKETGKYPIDHMVKEYGTLIARIFCDGQKT